MPVPADGGPTGRWLRVALLGCTRLRLGHQTLAGELPSLGLVPGGYPGFPLLGEGLQLSIFRFIWGLVNRS